MGIIFYVWLFDLKQQMGNFIPNVYIKEDVYGILPTVYKSKRISIFWMDSALKEWLII